MPNFQILPTTGYTTDFTHQLADALEVDGFDHQIPYIDVASQSVMYNERIIGVIGDNTLGSSTALAVAETLWQGVKNDPRWLAYTDPTKDVGGQLLQPGNNFLSVNFARALDIEIFQIGPGTNMWFPKSAVGKFGYVAFGDNLSDPTGSTVGDVHWLNFSRQSIFNHDTNMSFNPIGINVFLMPGSYGQCTVRRPTFPPPLIISGINYPRNTGYPWSTTGVTVPVQ